MIAFVVLVLLAGLLIVLTHIKTNGPSAEFVLNEEISRGDYYGAIWWTCDDFFCRYDLLGEIFRSNIEISKEEPECVSEGRVWFVWACGSMIGRFVSKEMALKYVDQVSMD